MAKVVNLLDDSLSEASGSSMENNGMEAAESEIKKDSDEDDEEEGEEEKEDLTHVDAPYQSTASASEEDDEESNIGDGKRETENKMEREPSTVVTRSRLRNNQNQHSTGNDEKSMSSKGESTGYSKEELLGLKDGADAPKRVFDHVNEYKSAKNSSEIKSNEFRHIFENSFHVDPYPTRKQGCANLERCFTIGLFWDQFLGAVGSLSADGKKPFDLSTFSSELNISIPKVFGFLETKMDSFWDFIYKVQSHETTTHLPTLEQLESEKFATVIMSFRSSTFAKLGSDVQRKMCAILFEQVPDDLLVEISVVLPKTMKNVNSHQALASLHELKKNAKNGDKNTMHAFLYICRAHILLNICKEAFQYKDAAMRTSIAIVLMAERKKKQTVIEVESTDDTVIEVESTDDELEFEKEQDKLGEKDTEDDHLKEGRAREEESQPTSKKRKVEEDAKRDNKGEGTADQDKTNEDELERLHEEWENGFLECAFIQLDALKYIINKSTLARKILGDELEMMLEKKRGYQEKK